MCLIVSRQGLTIETCRQIDLIWLASAVRVIIFFLRLVLIVARWSALFIKVGVACVY